MNGAESPVLCVVIDTEEEFDWSQPLSRENRSVTSIQAQGRAQEIFARYGIVPTYVVDHPVATDPEAVAVLKSYLDAGACEIGAHLHPWVNPPHEETVGQYNSYPGNLPEDLERRKLACLTEAVADSFGVRPKVYKAGRYGIGPNTGAILESLGYCVDTSVVPFTDFPGEGSPDFGTAPPVPGTLGPSGTLMALPLTAGFAGRLSRQGPRLYPRLTSPWGMRLRAPGIFARSGLLERIRLTPEGCDWRDHLRLVRAMLDEGWPGVFTYTYHSPSLAPGNTPYVRDAAQLDAFLDSMDRFFDGFFSEMKGRSATVMQIYADWKRQGGGGPAHDPGMRQRAS